MTNGQLTKSGCMCKCILYTLVFAKIGENIHRCVLPVESHAERKIVDRCLHCVLEDLGVDGGAGGVQHLFLGAQEDARCIHTLF